MTRAAPPTRTATPASSLHFTACKFTAPEDVTVASGEEEADVLGGIGLPYIPVVVLLGGELVAEVEFESGFATIEPPPVVGGIVEFPTFAAFAANAAKVLPDVGSLITPTIPVSQCFAWEQ